MYALSATLLSVGILAGCGSESQETNGGEVSEGSGGDYPSKNIQIIVPYSAGGGGDTVARMIADSLSDELGRQINVVNREGAGGEIGISEIARSDADGYTLGLFGYPDNFILEHTGNTDFSYDSFEYLAAYDDVPHALFVGPNTEFNTVEEFIEQANANPGSVTVGESGALGLLKVLAFENEADVDVTPVTYDGGGELINALLGGHIDVASSSITAAQQIVDAGGQPLGYAGSERLELFDEYPTFKEQGYDLQLGVTRVLVAPAGIPDEVREELVNALDSLSENEDFQQKFMNATLPYRYLNHDDLNEYLEQSNETLLPLIENNEGSF